MVVLFRSLPESLTLFFLISLILSSFVVGSSYGPQGGCYHMVESMGYGMMGLKYISALPRALVAVNSVSSNLPYKYPGV